MAQRSHKTATYSKTAAILADVLDSINSGCYDSGDDYILFGRYSVYDLIGDLTEINQEPETDRQALQELASDVAIHSGRELAAVRTSLGPAPKLSTRGAKALSREGRDRLVVALKKAISRAKSAPSRPQPAEAILDHLDAAYSNELVQKLEKVVQRAYLLNPHDVDASKVNDPGFRAAFEEAHRCFLYGFNRACAVMCRALIESGLKDRFDPAGKVEAKLQRRESLFKKLLEIAKLDKPLAEQAETVWTCGCFAAHNNPKFVKEYESQGKLPDVLCWTRAILAALYPKDGRA